MATKSLSFVFVLVLSGALGACSLTSEGRSQRARERGDAYMKEGKYKEASIEYQAAVQASPQDAASLFALARALRGEGQFREYRDTLGKVLRADPNHGPACVELGGLLWGAGNYVDALELARRALAKEPGSLDARRLEARSLASLGRREESRKAWGQVLAAAQLPDTAYVDAADFELWAGDAARAKDILGQGLRRHPQSAALLIATAELGALGGDAKAAEEALARAVAANPDSTAVHGARARFLFAAGRAGDAEASLRSSLERFASDPERSAAMVLEAARIDAAQGRVKEASTLVEAEQKKNPKHADLAAVLADLLITQDRLGEAQALLDVARGTDPERRQVRLLEARLYLKSGRSFWALQILEPLVGAGDLSLDTHLLYATALAREQRWAKARAEYKAILRRMPDHLVARLDYANVLYVCGDPVGALSLLDAIPSPVRSAPRVQFLRARALLDAGDASKARALLLELEEKAPRNASVLKALGDAERALGRADAALALYARARAVEPKALDALLAEASLREERGANTAEVARFLEDFQKGNGDSPAVLNYLARLYLTKGNMPAASQAIERSLLVEPNYADTKNLKGQVFLAQKQETKAAQQFREAINANPYSPDGYAYLAEILLAKGKTGEAEELYRRLLEQNPGEPTGSNNLASLYLEQGKVQEALPLAQDAHAGDPKSPAFQDTLGWALERAGRSKEAAPHLERALRQMPDAAEALYHRGVNLKSLGRPDEARPLLEKVVRLASGTDLERRATEALR